MNFTELKLWNDFTEQEVVREQYSFVWDRQAIFLHLKTAFESEDISIMKEVIEIVSQGLNGKDFSDKQDRAQNLIIDFADYLVVFMESAKVPPAVEIIREKFSKIEIKEDAKVEKPSTQMKLSERNKPKEKIVIGGKPATPQKPYVPFWKQEYLVEKAKLEEFKRSREFSSDDDESMGGWATESAGSGIQDKTKSKYVDKTTEERKGNTNGKS